MPQEQDNDKVVQGLISVINKLILVIVVLVAGIIAMPFILNYKTDTQKTISKTNVVSNEGIIEIVTKKEQGWSYIKSGF